MKLMRESPVYSRPSTLGRVNHVGTFVFFYGIRFYAEPLTGLHKQQLDEIIFNHVCEIFFPKSFYAASLISLDSSAETLTIQKIKG